MSLRVLLAAAAALTVACAGPVRGDLSAPGAGDGRSVYVVGHGWHAGVVLRRADVPPGALPPLPGLPDGEWLEIGWGDRDFYQDPQAGSGLALRAALLPTPGVLHVVSFRGPVAEQFPDSRITRLDLTPAGFEALVDRLAASFTRDAQGRAVDLGAGLYGDSRFFASRERYHLFRTCNAWTAAALRVAGLPVVPALTLSTRRLFAAVDAHGVVLAAGPPGED